MKNVRKCRLRRILDACIFNLHPLVIILLGVFGSVFFIGFWFAHWTDEIFLTSYRIYDVMSDNIGEKSYTVNVLKDLLPVDAVYTWVNGSDPLMLENYRKFSKSEKFICNYDNCFPSPYFATEINGKHGPRKTSQYLLKYLQRSVIRKGNKSKYFDIFIQQEMSPEFASKIISTSYMTQAYWTSDLKVEWSLAWNKAMIIRLESADDIHYKISKLALHYYEDILKKCMIASHYKTYVVDCSDQVLAETLKQKLDSFRIKHKLKYPKVWKANLILQSGFKSRDFDLNRFNDNEELRYSLRSLEKFAPWVRRIFLVTNGQIPYWVNLDHPRIRIVTHDEIFTDKSHLPTFSSPAIEAHIHQIPGLSQHFIYFNDDILLGKPVWPDDFYAPTSGYKIYTSASLPECSYGCPSSWVSDGYCDLACNTSACQWDGGDCPVSTDKISNGYPLSNNASYCSSTCSDSFLADMHCDADCKSLSCGFDAGDCGIDVVKENMMQLPFEINYSENISLVVPHGQLSAWINIRPLAKSVKNVTLNGKYSGLSGVRRISANTVLGVVIFVLKENCTGIIEVELAVSVSKKNLINDASYEIRFFVYFDTRSVSLNSKYWKENFSVNESNEASNYSLEELSSKILRNVFNNETDEMLKFSSNRKRNHFSVVKKVGKLHERLVNNDLIERGFVVKKGQHANRSLHRKVIQTSLNPPYHVKVNNTASDRLKIRKILSVHQDPSGLSNNRTLNDFWRNFLWKRNIDGALIWPDTQEVARTGRRLLNIFGDSLLYVNRLYNAEYGYDVRNEVAHMPHFINKEILIELNNKFSHEFHVTSSHKVRQGNDMQFAFSYFYFLMSERRQMTQEELFDQFDTDLSGIWSDREIRTFLTQTQDLPLRFSSFLDFNSAVKNCSKKINSKPDPAPAHERYAASDLPTISKELIVNCNQKLIQEKFKKLSVVPRFRHTLVSNSEVQFKMITSNVSSVTYHLDEIRKTPRKFICINSDLDQTSENSDLIRSLVRDTYEALYPFPSSFELSANYRNRHAYMWQLKEWNRWKHFIRSLFYAFLSCLILTVAAFITAEIKVIKRKWWCRRRRRKDYFPLVKIKAII